MTKKEYFMRQTLRKNIFSILDRVLLGAFIVLLMPSNGYTETPTKHALLIGIDEYKAVGDLNGCVNDIELMRSILIGKFEIPDENITLLKNEEATRANIIQAIQSHLIEKANPGDVVLLHYSGHGSQMLDHPGGDEIDGYDETIVPHDSRTEGVFDISDDEINGLLQKLTERTKNVTFILDSCHSGAAARAGNAVRMVEPDDRQPPAAEDFAISTRAGEGDADIRLNGADYVLISGCLATELSNETDFNNRRHGAMTWFLAEALQAAKPDATYRSVMDSVQANVTNRFPSQHPQIEGPGMDLKIFGTDKINPRPYLLVTAVEGEMLTLNGGNLVGLKKDTLLSVFAPGTSDLENTEPIATVKIVSVEDFKAQAEVIDGEGVSPQSRVLIEYSNFASVPATVFVDASQSASMSEVRALLSESNALKLVDTQDQALLVIEQQGDAISVLSGDLEQLAPAVTTTDPDHVNHVANQIKDIVHWRTLRDLTNSRSSLNVGFEAYRKGTQNKLRESAVVTPGERIIYKVKNLDNSRPLFVYVLDISSDGSVALLYPPLGEQQELAPGAVLEREVELFIPPGHRSVTDIFKVIATTRFIDPAIFPQGAVRSASLPQDVRSGDDPLANFLAEASRGMRGAAPVEVDSWVTAQHTLIIRPPGARTSGFTLHFDESREADSIPATVGASRNVCQQNQDPESSTCLSLRSLDEENTVFEIDSKKLTRSDAENRSIGALFEEAYQIQDQTGAIRVEPKLEVEAPGVVDQQGIDKREILGDSGHDGAARDDDKWNLKQIRVEAAWQKIRDRHGVGEGQEGSGILVAHTDTGYVPHPENWQEIDGKRPIDPAKGHDYFDDDDDPTDPLLSDNKLDNPGHGTASGSVIVSPAGCQLTNTPGCVYGVARGAQLAPLRVHRTVSQIDTSNLAKAIRDVANGNVEGEPKLVSIAMGGPPTLNLYKAVKEAEQNGILIVAAAGNYVRTVVWPARFDATIAAAAVNVRCRPWKHTSRGKKVDISAPGESVWRATLNKDGDYINFMGKGTTFATGNTSSAAALWLSWHRDTPELSELQRKGEVTTAFRNALEQSAWQPTGTDNDPEGTHCDSFDWNSKKYGSGILDINALLDVPLQSPGARSLTGLEIEHIPLYASLYPEQAPSVQIISDFLMILNSVEDSDLPTLSRFETEIMHHYTVDEDVQRTIDAVVAGQRGDEPMSRIRESLVDQDLSERLRDALMRSSGA